VSEPLRILIVDDEAPARTRLKDLLADVAAEVPNHVVAEAADGVAALAQLADHAADVALVDIRMPRMDGIELARHLADLPQAPAVVFTTAYDRYAVAAFDVNAVDYLLKPVRAARLAEALRKAMARPLAGETMRKTAAALLPQGRRHLRCSERGKVLLVPVDDVLYLRAEQKYVTARTKERDYLIEDSLAQLEEEFAGRFLRIHRNCLVARAAISGFERAHGEEEGHWALLLKGVDEKLPVSRRQWPQVKAAIGGRDEAEAG
jgi:two-component system response regulator AlgR